MRLLLPPGHHLDQHPRVSEPWGRGRDQGAGASQARPPSSHSPRTSPAFRSRWVSCEPGPIIGRSGRDPISLEGLAQEKPNPRVSNPVEGGMSQPEGLDT